MGRLQCLLPQRHGLGTEPAGVEVEGGGGGGGVSAMLQWKVCMLISSFCYLQAYRSFSLSSHPAPAGNPRPLENFHEWLTALAAWRNPGRLKLTIEGWFQLQSGFKKKPKNRWKAARFKRQLPGRRRSSTVDSKESCVARTDSPAAFQAPHLLFSRGSASAEGQVNRRHRAALGEGLAEQRPSRATGSFSNVATVTCNNVRISLDWGQGLRLASRCVNSTENNTHTNR